MTPSPFMGQFGGAGMFGVGGGVTGAFGSVGAGSLPGVFGDPFLTAPSLGGSVDLLENSTASSAGAAAAGGAASAVGGGGAGLGLGAIGAGGAGTIGAGLDISGSKFLPNIVAANRGRSEEAGNGDAPNSGETNVLDGFKNLNF